MKNQNNCLLKITVAVTFIAMVVINALSNILPINNRGTEEISDQYSNLFAPAGITFSIWGLIYLLLFLYTIYQMGCWQKKPEKSREKLFQEIGILFIMTSILNATWIFAWHYDYILWSVVIMLCLLTFLIKIANILRKEKMSWKDHLLIKLPFSIYFGWITVATIANITILLVKYNWNGFGLTEQFWTIAILLIGALIGIIRMSYDRNLPYGLVFVWAYSGILYKHLSPYGFNHGYEMIITTAMGCIVAFLLVAGILSYRKIDDHLEK